MPALPRQPARPTFKVGDVVEPWRHFTADGVFAEGADEARVGTLWKVLRVGPVEVTLELLSGGYQLYEDEAPMGPGHVMRLRNSTVYRRHFRRAHPCQQAWDQYRVVTSVDPQHVLI